jgi:hypothetical protein
MAVSTLISVSGVVPPRPIEALVPVMRVATPQRDGTPESVSSQTVRDLSAGLGPRERQRIENQQNAERLRELAAQVEADRQMSEAIEKLDEMRGQFEGIVQLVEQAQAGEVSDDQRSDIEAQARELAGSIGAEVSIGGTSSGPEVTSLGGFGFQPGMLGTIESVRAASGDPDRTEELRAASAAAAEAVTAAREQLAADRAAALATGGEITPATVAATERIEEQLGLLNSEEAREIVTQINEETRTQQGEPLIHHLTTLVPDNVVAVVP